MHLLVHFSLVKYILPSCPLGIKWFRFMLRNKTTKKKEQKYDKNNYPISLHAHDQEMKVSKYDEKMKSLNNLPSCRGMREFKVPKICPSSLSVIMSNFNMGS